MEIPHRELSETALRGVVESYVLREGTDYGHRHYSFEEKIAAVMRQLDRGEAVVVFDAETETVSIVVASPPSRRARMSRAREMNRRSASSGASRATVPATRGQDWRSAIRQERLRAPSDFGFGQCDPQRETSLPIGAATSPNRDAIGTLHSELPRVAQGVEPPMTKPFSHIPLPVERSMAKPRRNGLTMMMDWGLPLGQQGDWLDLLAPVVDLAKLVVGTARLYEEDYLRRKLDLYSSHGVRPFLGGQFMEYVFATQGMDGVKPFCRESVRLGIHAIEVSDNVVALDDDERRAIIGTAVECGLEVHGEVGSKSEDSGAETLVAQARVCFDAGADVVLVEGAELLRDGVPESGSRRRLARGARHRPRDLRAERALGAGHAPHGQLPTQGVSRTHVRPRRESRQRDAGRRVGDRGPALRPEHSGANGEDGARYDGISITAAAPRCASLRIPVSAAREWCFQ